MPPSERVSTFRGHVGLQPKAVGGSKQGVAKPRLKPILKMKRVELHEIQKISIYGECKDLFVKQ